MHKKIKIMISADVMAATMAGANPIPAATNTFITAEAAPKPSLSKKSTTLAVGQTLQLKMKNTKKPVKWYSSNKKR